MGQVTALKTWVEMSDELVKDLLSSQLPISFSPVIFFSPSKQAYSYSIPAAVNMLTCCCAMNVTQDKPCPELSTRVNTFPSVYSRSP